MPRHDPVPGPAGPAVGRFKRGIAWMALLAAVVAGIAIVLVAWGDPQVHPHMLIATGLGVFFTVLLGTGLMLLVFLSAQSGHDEEVSRRKENE